MSDLPEPTITVTPDAVETALRRYLRSLDYDLHKSIECGEEDGADHYPEEAAELFTALRCTGPAGEQELLGAALRIVAEYVHHATKGDATPRDLVTRLKQAGFPLPAIEEPTR
ncbi:hypothetical protein OH809_45495 (plasmid) [Streptomyces sp. NBC_00873]|uniref:hypothetical protein n=1 Tax=Streptomyces sp. NBC_00873 TaxID=2975852 RepID=UPI0037DCD1EF|nr:hypothetical protein OH809_45495 [Streptomyces sp. NBC_00873]